MERTAETVVKEPRQVAPVPNSQLLASALAKHQAGHISEAQTLYAQILKNNPSHADALHFSGLAAHQFGNNALAI